MTIHQLDINLTINDISSYIVIRRPISTINIDYIELRYLEVKTADYTKIFNIINEFEFL